MSRLRCKGGTKPEQCVIGSTIGCMGCFNAEIYNEVLKQKDGKL